MSALLYLTRYDVSNVSDVSDVSHSSATLKKDKVCTSPLTVKPLTSRGIFYIAHPKRSVILSYAFRSTYLCDCTLTVLRDE